MASDKRGSVIAVADISSPRRTSVAVKTDIVPTGYLDKK
jgi:hypothetical protein